MRVVAVFCLSLVFIGTLNTSRLSAQTVNDGGLWLAALGNGDLVRRCCSRPQMKWWFDAHYRLLDDADGFNQSIVRPGLGIDLGNNAAGWAGYGWIRTSPITGNQFDEHRIWQQWTWAPSCCGVKFLHRSRFEQRLVETGDDTGLRWRQFFRIQGRPNGHGCSPVLWDEAFFNLNDTDWGAQSGFDQNRVFVGIRLPERTSLYRAELGYLNQVINLPASGTRVNHILSLNFFF